MMSMKKKKKPHASDESRNSEALKTADSSEIKHAIADGFGEYRRQIADIRARHGRKARRSQEVLN